MTVLSALVVLASCKSGTEPASIPQFEAQTIDLPGVPNARQFGGYVIGDRQVRMDVLLRTGALANASEEALQSLHDRYKLALVADFRTSQERGKFADRIVEGTRYVWFPVLEKLLKVEDNADMEAVHINKDNPSFTLELMKRPAVQKYLRSTYDTIVFDEDYQRSYAAFLDSLVALPEGRAALWHCSHGKDRGGWGSAFVLAALGADRELIVADFGMSNIPYAKDIDELVSLAQSEGLADEMREDIYLLRGVSVPTFEKTLDSIDVRYGSLDNYLEQALLLTSEERAVMQDKFLVSR